MTFIFDLGRVSKLNVFIYEQLVESVVEKTDFFVNLCCMRRMSVY